MMFRTLRWSLTAEPGRASLIAGRSGPLKCGSCARAGGEPARNFLAPLTAAQGSRPACDSSNGTSHLDCCTSGCSHERHPLTPPAADEACQQRTCPVRNGPAHRSSRVRFCHSTTERLRGGRGGAESAYSELSQVEQRRSRAVVEERSLIIAWFGALHASVGEASFARARAGCAFNRSLLTPQPCGAGRCSS